MSRIQVVAKIAVAALAACAFISTMSPASAGSSTGTWKYYPYGVASPYYYGGYGYQRGYAPRGYGYRGGYGRQYESYEPQNQQPPGDHFSGR